MADYDSLALSGASFSLGATSLYPGATTYAAGVSITGDIFVDFDSRNTLYGQAYNQFGAPAGGSVLLRQDYLPPFPLSVTPLIDGGWATAWMTWTGSGPSASEGGVINAAGSLVSTFELGANYGGSGASVAGLGNGGFVAEWTA